jgi:hypothetical protein
MALFDLLLNLVGLLLWFGWRAVGLDQTTRPAPLSLVSTLKRAESHPSRPWPLLAGLLALLVMRSTLYWRLGPQTGWAPTLDLGLVSVSFRVDLGWHALVFSLGSFLHAWIIAHVAILLIILLNRKSPEAGSFQVLFNAQWGRLARWPASILVLLLPLVGTALWMVTQPLFLWLELTSPAPPDITPSPLQQGAAFGLSLFLLWESVALGLLIIHTINTYVYVGNLGLWNCLACAGRNLCRRFPLRIGRIDLAPLAVAALIIALAYAASHGITLLFHQPLR